MKPEELVEQLRRAGINASLVNRMHDCEIIEISGDIPDTVESNRQLINATIQGCHPPIDTVIVPYEYPRVGRMSNEELDKFTKIAEGLRILAKESLESNKTYITGDSTGRIITALHKHGYIETPSGRRRYLRRKSTMDDNSTLR